MQIETRSFPRRSQVPGPAAWPLLRPVPGREAGLGASMLGRASGIRVRSIARQRGRRRVKRPKERMSSIFGLKIAASSWWICSRCSFFACTDLRLVRTVRCECCLLGVQFVLGSRTIHLLLECELQRKPSRTSMPFWSGLILTRGASHLLAAGLREYVGVFEKGAGLGLLEEGS